MQPAIDLFSSLGAISAAIAILGGMAGLLTFLYRHPPARRITLRQMRRHAKRLASRIQKFHPALVICLSLRGAVVASLLQRNLNVGVPVLVAMQYFSEDGVDPRIYTHFALENSAPELLCVTEESEQYLFLPSEISCLSQDSEWGGRLLIFAGGDSEPLATVAMARIRALFDPNVVRDLSQIGTRLASSPRGSTMRRLLEGVIEPRDSDVIVAVGQHMTLAANHFAQYILKRWQVHLPTIVCSEVVVLNEELERTRRRLTGQVAGAQPARPLSTNISHTYLPLDLSRWLPLAMATGNVLLVDDYTASGSMLTRVKEAISSSKVTDSSDWRLAPERIATMTIAHRATDIPGRDRDNSITTFRGIPVRSLFRRSGREVLFPWPRH